MYLPNYSVCNFAIIRKQKVGNSIELTQSVLPRKPKIGKEWSQGIMRDDWMHKVHVVEKSPVGKHFCMSGYDFISLADNAKKVTRATGYVI